MRLSRSSNMLEPTFSVVFGWQGPEHGSVSSHLVANKPPFIKISLQLFFFVIIVCSAKVQQYVVAVLRRRQHMLLRVADADRLRYS